MGISRETGAAQPSVKFEFKVIDSGSFVSKVTLVNYELRQLGLLAHILAGLDDGWVRLGYGKRRGFGKVKIGIPTLTFRWVGVFDPDAGVPSLASLVERSRLPGDWGCRDKGLSLKLRPELTKTVIGSTWSLPVPQKDGRIDWTAELWPSFAALLPETLRTWPRETVAAPEAIP